MKVCTKTIVCHNIKGGVGKSTVAVNISYNLSTLGYRVLGIDLDPQKNYTPFFRKADENKTVYDLFGETKKVRSHIFRSKYENLDIIKGSARLTDMLQDSHILSEILYPVKNRYDYIIIDCRTSNEMLTQNAMVAGDYLLTPVLLDGYCRDNLADEKEIYDSICYYIGKEMEWGVFANRVRNKKSQREIYIDLTRRHQYPFLDTCITERTAVEDALRLRKPLLKHARNNQVTSDFIDLTKEIILRTGGKCDGRF